MGKKTNEGVRKMKTKNKSDKLMEIYKKLVKIEDKYGSDYLKEAIQLMGYDKCLNCFRNKK